LQGIGLKQKHDEEMKSLTESKDKKLVRQYALFWKIQIDLMKKELKEKYFAFAFLIGFAFALFIIAVISLAFWLIR
jgi:hypothetical protein